MGWFDDVAQASRADRDREFLDLVRAWAPRLSDFGISPGDTGVFPSTESTVLEVEVALPPPAAHNLHVALLSSSRLLAEPSFDGYILDGGAGPWTLAREVATAAEAADAAEAWLEAALTAELHIEHVGGRSAVRVLVGELAEPLFRSGWWWPWQRPERRRVR